MRERRERRVKRGERRGKRRGKGEEKYVILETGRTCPVEN